MAVEGLQIRGWYRPSRPDAEVMLQLELHPSAAKARQLERIEWRPLGKHKNKRPIPGIAALQFTGSHIHEFELNYLESEQRMLANNLPNARPLSPDVSDFEKLLALAESRLNVKGLCAGIPEPDWERTLFDD